MLLTGHIFFSNIVYHEFLYKSVNLPNVPRYELKAPRPPTFYHFSTQGWELHLRDVRQFDGQILYKNAHEQNLTISHRSRDICKRSLWGPNSDLEHRQTWLNRLNCRSWTYLPHIICVIFTKAYDIHSKTIRPRYFVRVQSFTW